MTQYGPPVPCFWIEPIDRIERFLRRYHHDEGTPGGWTCAEGWHNARTPIEPVNDDPRWPATCERCAYAFVEGDAWQLFIERVYRALDGRWEGHLGLGENGPPAGAMWDSWWMPEQWHGPDGFALTVQLPDGGYWLVDGPSSSGGAWTRSGDPRATPPTVDVNPSIASGDPETYHGHLRHGELVSV